MLCLLSLSYLFMAGWWRSAALFNGQDDRALSPVVCQGDNPARWRLLRSSLLFLADGSDGRRFFVTASLKPSVPSRRGAGCSSGVRRFRYACCGTAERYPPASCLT